MMTTNVYNIKQCSTPNIRECIVFELYKRTDEKRDFNNHLVHNIIVTYGTTSRNSGIMMRYIIYLYL